MAYQITNDQKTAQKPRAIEWTNWSWNPVRGCDRISPGCDHCHAERFAERFRGVLGHPYEQGFDFKLAPHKLIEPLTLSTSKMIFVNSMSDLFHKRIPDNYLATVCKVMQQADSHIYQVLTKRSSRMRNYLTDALQFAASLPHIWWGVSVEDRSHGLPRIEHLQQCPVAVRFLSIEPLLEDLGIIDLAGIYWVIVGGESGPGARAMRADWVRSLLDQCRESAIPFFFKQWGGVNKKRTGRLLDGRTYDEYPNYTFKKPPSPNYRKQMINEIEAAFPPEWHRDDRHSESARVSLPQLMG